MSVNRLNEYADLIEQAVPAANEWDEELNNISHVRHMIHRDLDGIDHARLRRLDVGWQAQLLATKESDFTFSYPRDDLPKSFWWAWIDKIDQLTDEERSTL